MNCPECDHKFDDKERPYNGYCMHRYGKYVVYYNLCPSRRGGSNAWVYGASDISNDDIIATRHTETKLPFVKLSEDRIEKLMLLK